jgi:RNA polymerase sigma factor (sigma-70 family)
VEGDSPQKAVFSFPIDDEQATLLRPKLFNIAKSYARYDRHLAEDLVQEAFVALIDGRRKWRSPYVAARSAMLDYLLKQRSVALVGYDIALCAEYDTLLQMMEVEEMESFEGLGLSEEERSIARLYFVEGLTQTEVAAEVGVSQNIVSVRLRRVRQVIYDQWIGD